jgi:hypothetical protein
MGLDFFLSPHPYKSLQPRRLPFSAGAAVVAMAFFFFFFFHKLCEFNLRQQNSFNRGANRV